MAAASARCEAAPGSENLSLAEFVQAYELPQPAIVTEGKYLGRKVQVYKGDVLLLRSHLPSSLTLSFLDADGRKRAVSVSTSNCQVKFLVLPAKNSSSDEAENGDRLEYPTVSDLIEDSPTYFQATANYDEPYLPACSVRAGDIFRFLRVWRDPRDGKAGVECVDKKGNTVRLAGRCKGNFVPLEDDHPYTLRELVLQARVSRRLRMAPANSQLQINAAELRNSGKLDTLVSQLELIREKAPTMAEAEAEVNSMCSIQDLPVTFKGVINLHRPQNDLIVSPWKDLDIRWKIPMNSDLKLRLYSPDDYEQPVEQKIATQNISQFVEEHESKLPALATLMSYPDMHQDLVPHLKNISDIIVHRSVRVPRLLVKAETTSDYFLISGQTNVRLCDTPRTYTSVDDLLTCPVGTQIRVMESVASDFPEPIVLRTGNILRVTHHDVHVKKVKGAMADAKMLKCEILGENGLFKKMRLPLDLEVEMLQVMNPETMKIYSINELLGGQTPFPMQPVAVMEEYSDTDLPLPALMELVDVIMDRVIIVSPLSYSGDQVGISPLVQRCVEISERHKHVLLAFGRALDFPQTYFVMPKETTNVNIRCERLSRKEAERLRSRHREMEEYEDVDLDCSKAKGASCDAKHASTLDSKTPDTCSKTSLSRSHSAGTLNSKKSQLRDKMKQPAKRLTQLFGKGFGKKEIEEETRTMSSIGDLSQRQRQPSTNEYSASWMDAPLPPNSSPPARPSPQADPSQPVAPPRRHRKHRHRAEEDQDEEDKRSSASYDEYADEDPYEDVMPTHATPKPLPDPRQPPIVQRPPEPRKLSDAKKPPSPLKPAPPRRPPSPQHSPISRQPSQPQDSPDTRQQAPGPRQPPAPPPRVRSWERMEASVPLPMPSQSQANGTDKRGRISGRFRRKKNPSGDSSESSQDGAAEGKAPAKSEGNNAVKEKLSDFKEAMKKRFSKQ